LYAPANQKNNKQDESNHATKVYLFCYANKFVRKKMTKNQKNKRNSCLVSFFSGKNNIFVSLTRQIETN